MQKILAIPILRIHYDNNTHQNDCICICIYIFSYYSKNKIIICLSFKILNI